MNASSTVSSRSGPPRALELWGGVECTYNRVGEEYFSQIEWNGHLHRSGDLERFSSLGIRALRYPVLWEMMCPNQYDPVIWQFSDQRLLQMRELKIRPIADLVHHGSGPRYAPIHTAAFAPALAEFARRVAERFPWIDAYTPVNEPLTTARFCGLYGLWYPHERNHRSFVRIVMNECVATILAMKEIRKINARAQLVQTDDLGRIYSTELLTYEADYQNERRWLAWDLLCGKVDKQHPLWDYLRSHGIVDAELHWVMENACPPDVVGVNYYPTSDRYLDERLGLYEDVHPTRNERHRYVDVEAVRAREETSGGFYERLMEAWDRYRLPMAITESHLGCTREEQIRWFAESWEAAERAAGDGADVLAVTAWSLLGAFNWDTLVTRDAGHYEPGVFDVRGTEPRETAIAPVLRALSEGRKPDHPALHHVGWWRRPERLFETHRALTARSNPLSRKAKSGVSKVLIIGATGTLGRAFVEACEVRGLPYHPFSRCDLDLTDPSEVMGKIGELRPWAVINAAGYVKVDDAEENIEGCFAVNARGAARLAQACAAYEASLLCFSSDLVFDGLRNHVYLERDRPAPLNAYGRSKVAMEQRVLEAFPGALIARTSAFFGPEDDWNFVTTTLRSLKRGETVLTADDVIISPTYVPDLVRVSFDLLIDGASGIWHLANEGELSWAVLAELAAIRCGVDPSGIRPCSHWEFRYKATRPMYSALGTQRGQIMPSFEHALDEYARAVVL